MDESMEVTDIKKEPTDSTSSDQAKIPTEIQPNPVEKETDCLVQSEIYIKIEPQEVENEFPVTASTSFEMCPNYDTKIKTEKPFIKIEYEDPVDEILEDPLDVDSDIEVPVAGHFLTHLDQDELKTESTEKENDENISESDEEDLHGRSNQSQDQLLVRKKPGRRKHKKYVCTECNKVLTKKSNLDSHLRIHSGEKPFACDFCEKTFSVKGNLDRHMLVHSGEKPHVCEVCDKFFTQKTSLDRHKLIHSETKSLSCKESDKLFTQKQDLVAHNQIHTKKKPYACSMCDKAFKQKSDLTRHTRTHTGEKPYSCDVCNKSYASNSSLNQHKKIHMN